MTTLMLVRLAQIDHWSIASNHSSLAEVNESTHGARAARAVALACEAARACGHRQVKGRAAARAIPCCLSIGHVLERVFLVNTEADDRIGVCSVRWEH